MFHIVVLNIYYTEKNILTYQVTTIISENKKMIRIDKKKIKGMLRS
jgi:hypothetical protein